MEFNITRLDKILLLQTLYVHADPKGYGEKQYRQLLKEGKTVEGLPDAECQTILKGINGGGGYMVDYYNGKPLKQDWRKASNGELLVHSLPYDVAHGKFRFLEALLNVFDPDEIIITQKEYNQGQDKLFFQKEDTRIIEYELAQILDHAIACKDESGNYWQLDPGDTSYHSAFLNGLDI